MSAVDTLGTCELQALGWVSRDRGTDFMNNRRRLPPDGSAKKTSVWDQGNGENGGKLKVGGERKRGFLALHTKKTVLEIKAKKKKLQPSSAKRAVHRRIKWLTKRGKILQLYYQDWLSDSFVVPRGDIKQCVMWGIYLCRNTFGVFQNLM